VVLFRHPAQQQQWSLEIERRRNDEKTVVPTSRWVVGVIGYEAMTKETPFCDLFDHHADAGL